MKCGLPGSASDISYEKCLVQTCYCSKIIVVFAHYLDILGVTYVTPDYVGVSGFKDTSYSHVCHCKPVSLSCNGEMMLTLACTVEGDEVCLLIACV